MFTLRCTQKVLKRLKTPPNPNPPPNTTLMGDWYVDVIVQRPAHLLLFVNEPTRLAVVTEAKNIGELQPRFCIALFKLLAALDIEPDLIDEEMKAMSQPSDMCIAKTASRSVLGTMLDYRNVIAFENHAPASLQRLTFVLSDHISNVLKHYTPGETTRVLFKPRLTLVR